MPGYGASSKHPEHAVDLGVQGRLLTDLLAHWGLAAPHVVAHDIGGAVSLRARLLHGAAYASLALVDVVALRPWGSPFFRLVQEHADVFGQLPSAIHRGAVEAYVRGASHRGLDDGQLATLVGPWLGEEGQAAFYRQIAQADERFTDEVEPRLRGAGPPRARRLGSRGHLDPAGPRRAAGGPGPGRLTGRPRGRRPPGPVTTPRRPCTPRWRPGCPPGPGGGPEKSLRVRPGGN